MGYDADIFVTWVNDLLLRLGLSSTTISDIDGWVILLLIALFILLINAILRWGILRSIKWIIHHTKAQWDDIAFNNKVLKRMSGIVTPVILKASLPLIFSAIGGDHPWLYMVTSRIIDIYIVVAFVLFINALLKALFAILERRPSLGGKPIKGLLQTGQGIVISIAAILIVSIIINKSPLFLLTGLGASAAVLMLIFKDSILGLVAGVQLSANDMLKVGDWIEMPQRGIDGVVESVSLTTIKVRGWDNTMQTLPPYLLISEPFDNWQAMFNRGGRRIKRSINIDIKTIDFIDDSFVEKLRTSKVTAELVEQILPLDAEVSKLTNLDLFMRCVECYVRTHPKVHKSMLMLVRQLQPSEWGLPVEIYCFSSNVMWVHYEKLQSEIISYAIALAPHFNLSIYQAPTTLSAKC